jgi:Uma2 family endonuclease
VNVARRLVSEADFLALPETVERVELVDGEVYVPPSPNFWHQETLARIVVSLRLWAERRAARVTVCQAPLDVRFGPNRILQPDAFVIMGAISPDHEGPIERIPELCIEVLSTNRAYDRVTKRFIYAEAGVHELWTVEPAGFVERWAGPALSQSELVRETLRSPLLPEFELDLTRLWSV